MHLIKKENEEEIGKWSEKFQAKKKVKFSICESQSIFLVEGVRESDEHETVISSGKFSLDFFRKILGEKPFRKRSGEKNRSEAKSDVKNVDYIFHSLTDSSLSLSLICDSGRIFLTILDVWYRKKPSN